MNEPIAALRGPLATDIAGGLVIEPSTINLSLVQEMWPDVSFAATRELAPMPAA